MNHSSFQSLCFRTIVLFALLLGSSSCREKKPDTPPGSDTTKKAVVDTAAVPVFSGANAYEYVSRQCGFGPRNPGSPGARKALEFYLEQLRMFADTVMAQPFEMNGYDGAKLHLTNVIASFNLKASRRILLVAHWDTRPRAEEDKNPAMRDKPIIGANDGGSGVAVLLELARIMKGHPPAVGIDILLVDGEDYGKESDLDNYFLGARYFAKNLPAGYKPVFGVLLDMVGDANAQFPKEPGSMKYAPDVVEALWKAAADLGLRQFLQSTGPGISDDHVPLSDSGIATIDIIDATMVGNRTGDARRNYWHTSGDTLDKISAETLEAVGKLMVHMIYRMAPAA